MERFCTLYTLFPSRFLANLQTTCLIYNRHQKQSPLEVFLRKGALRKIHRKHLCESPATLLKRRPWHRCFPVNFAEFLGTPFLTERTASKNQEEHGELEMKNLKF